jgi:hypothetical protein
MKFGFKLGKKEKEAVEELPVAEEAIDVQPVEELIATAEPVKPHAPLQELTLDVENPGENNPEEALEPATPEEEAETIKLAEVRINPDAAVPPPPPPPSPLAPTHTATAAPPPSPIPAASPGKDGEKKKDSLDLGASIGNIFNDLEEEENPLANLIKALPDVAATELIDDLKEINDIIKDWQKK